MADEFERPILTVDLVPLTVHEGRLAVLLARREHEPCRLLLRFTSPPKCDWLFLAGLPSCPSLAPFFFLFLFFSLSPSFAETCPYLF